MKSSPFLLACFAALQLADAQKHTFPTSPDVPYSKQLGAPDGSLWGEAIKKATKRFKDENWTLEEKVKLATGNGWPGGQCEANTPSIARVNWPGQCITDGPLGIRAADNISAFGSGINAAATFDRKLMRKRAAAIGREYREKGINVHLGPMTNIQRTPLSGRIWEGAGGDTYLAGEVTYEHIKGIQSWGVQANVKHFINNEQELSRGWMSTNVNDRTQHEIYLHPFLRAVQADVASVMASYNKINQTWGTENSKTINGLLKHELGFNGYVLSDFFGAHTTVKAMNAGLDMILPIGSLYGDNLVNAVKAGNVTMDRIDDMATRILSSWYLLGQDKNFPETNFDFFDNNSKHNKHVDVQHDHYKIIREGGAASHVLLKNTDSFLPLVKPRSIVLIGTDAGPPPFGPNYYHDQYLRPDDRSGVLAMGWGSGATWFPYLIDPLQAIQAKTSQIHTDLNWFLEDGKPEEAAQQARDKSVAIVFIMADSGEETEGKGDRPDFLPWHKGNENVLAVANANPNTIVVVHSVGPIVMEDWISHPNVKAVVWAGIQGQEVGNSLVDVLWGDVNPSGRLPYTIAKNGSDYSTNITHDTDTWETPQVEYDEELFVDYKHFDARNITPRFEFGFGLSYTTFAYDSLKVQALNNALDGPPKGFDSSVQGASVAAWLHEPRYIVSVGIQNTGNVGGHEVPQLYVEFPEDAGEPPKLLRGFERLYLHPTQRDEVHFSISHYDLSIWDVVAQRWRRPEGKFKVHVGASSRDIRLSANLDKSSQRKVEQSERENLFVTQPGGY